MRKGEAYPLYNSAEQFIEEARRQGFKLYRNRYLRDHTIKPDASIQISTGIRDIGEIVDNRFLIIFTDIRNKGNGEFNAPISKLQKLARQFIIK